MPRVIKGFSTSSLQPGSTISIDRDGLMTGTARFDGDAGVVIPSQPIVGQSTHPRDSRLRCESVQLTWKANGKAESVANYIGLNSDPTIPRIEFAGGSGQEPIEAHPDFEKFAGTQASPKNGATFDQDTGEFLGFFNGSFQGVTSYILPSIIVNYTYYTSVVPPINQVGRIVSNLPNFPRPPNVKNYLRIAMPYRQVAHVYQVTEQFLGSGEKGWNRNIY